MPAPDVHMVLVSDPALLGEPVLAPSVAEMRAAAMPETNRVASTVRVAGHGLAPVAGLDDASRTNIQLAVYLLDGTVMEPGAQLSFDDVARTWDFREDPRYVWGWGTSSYGLIHMQGGGACWVSTALWRAALVAGLRTDFRDNHYGLVHSLGAGTDATNTLVIRNNLSEPITVRAWVDDENVNVALFYEGTLGRSAKIRGPERLGPGRYVLYQDVTWDDSSVTTTPFYSGYSW